MVNEERKNDNVQEMNQNEMPDAGKRICSIFFKVCISNNTSVQLRLFYCRGK